MSGGNLRGTSPADKGGSAPKHPLPTESLFVMAKKKTPHKFVSYCMWCLLCVSCLVMVIKCCLYSDWCLLVCACVHVYVCACTQPHLYPTYLSCLHPCICTYIDCIWHVTGGWFSMISSFLGFCTYFPTVLSVLHLDSFKTFLPFPVPLGFILDFGLGEEAWPWVDT